MKRQFVLAGLSWAVLVVFMALTRPTELPVVLLIIPFVLLFIAVLSSWFLVEKLYRTYLMPIVGYKHKTRRFGVVMSLSIVGLTILQSLGQLTTKDVLVMAAILVLGYGYVLRNQRVHEGR